MTITPKSVLAHLALRFASHPENLATDALVFILEKSPAAREGLDRLFAQLQPGVAANLRYETQASNDDGSRPDLVGLDRDGVRAAILEVKFWAGLTDAQPVGYLQNMRPAERLLLFVAPAARLPTLWVELCQRVRGSGMPLAIEPESNDLRLAWCGAVRFAAISWRGLLGAILAAVEAAGDHATASDLRQLGALCDAMDTDAFLPLTSEEMTGTLGRRVAEFGSIASDLTDLLVADGIGDTKSLRSASANGVYGRYLRFKGYGAFLNFSGLNWARWGETPIWLNIRGADFKPEPAIGLMLTAAAVPFYAFEGEVRVPITLPLGVGRERVLAAAYAQLLAVAQALPQAAGSSAAITLPDDAADQPEP